MAELLCMSNYFLANSQRWPYSNFFQSWTYHLTVIISGMEIICLSIVAILHIIGATLSIKAIPNLLWFAYSIINAVMSRPITHWYWQRNDLYRSIFTIKKRLVKYYFWKQWAKYLIVNPNNNFCQASQLCMI